MGAKRSVRGQSAEGAREAASRDSGMLSAFMVAYRRPLILAFHVLLLPVAYLLAYALRFDGWPPAPYDGIFVRTVGWIVGLRLLAFGLFGLYRGWWRYVGVADLKALLLATTASSLAFIAILFLTGDIDALPRSIVPLDWTITLLLFGGGRLLVRMAREEMAVPGLPGLRQGKASGRPVIIIGAGNAGERLIAELKRDPDNRLRPVALVDDNARKHGQRIHGVPVLGDVGALADVARTCDAAEAIIAVPSATREQMNTILAGIRAAKLRCQIVPSLPELLGGAARLSQVREVKIDDLLGRRAVSLDSGPVRASLVGQTVMVTGGAGSIGSELVRQIAQYVPKRLIILDQAESPLYFIHHEVHAAFPKVNVTPVVCDVADAARVNAAVAKYAPDYVFHAAAYKHVPLMEDHVVEAVRNNVRGTLNVAAAAAEHGCKRFVLISTDKAVRPSSIMGATKRIAERVVLGYRGRAGCDGAATDFRAVRFGNVLGSDGSVIPLFKKQLAKGGPLTVTHPEVTRYFMTIPEAVQLVLAAATLPEAKGRISMLEMGQPVKIAELARNLIRLSGLEPDVDVEVAFTGLRAGEKLYEELMGEVEATVPTKVDKIRVVQTDEPDPASLWREIDALLDAVAAGREEKARPLIRRLVPECVQPLGTRPATRPEPAAREERPASIVGNLAAEVGGSNEAANDDSAVMMPLAVPAHA